MSSKLPEKFLESLEGVPGFDKAAFINTHESANRVVSVRLNNKKTEAGTHRIFPDATPVPWSSHGYYLPSRPSFTLDPLLHAGAYYVQEASSMFIEQCIRQHVVATNGIKVLDLCAAPGGKSTLMLSIIGNNSLLVSNEVIKSRVTVLNENLTKWGGANVVVTNNDPADFARLESFFDVMVIDAPCSGSGLFRRDPDAIQEWSEDAVQMCSVRQRRILADSFATLKSGGLLVYSTCSYSVQEDEDICDWLVENFDVTPLDLSLEPGWNIAVSSSRKRAVPGYRFYPDKLKGEGFFTACFRKNDGSEDGEQMARKRKLTKLPEQDIDVAKKWISEPSIYDYYDLEQQIIAFPSEFDEALAAIHSNLYVKKAGIRLGKVMKNELVPDHELAVSGVANKNLQAVMLNRDEALQYLRKEEVKLDDNSLKGWVLVQYMQMNLGWIKNLGNRVNNYYPKEWRILKSGNN